MPTKSQTKSNIILLQNKIDSLKKELNKIKKITNKEMWLNDISLI
jgi:hypothetical protein